MKKQIKAITEDSLITLFKDTGKNVNEIYADVIETRPDPRGRIIKPRKRKEKEKKNIAKENTLDNVKSLSVEKDSEKRTENVYDANLKTKTELIKDYNVPRFYIEKCTPVVVILNKKYPSKHINLYNPKPILEYINSEEYKREFQPMIDRQRKSGKETIEKRKEKKINLAKSLVEKCTIEEIPWEELIEKVKEEYDGKAERNTIISYILFNLSSYKDDIYEIDRQKDKIGNPEAKEVYRKAIEERIEEVYPELKEKGKIEN